MAYLNPRATSRNTGWQMIYQGTDPNVFPITMSGLTADTALDSFVLGGGTVRPGDLLKISAWATSGAVSGTPAAYSFRCKIGPIYSSATQIILCNLTPSTPTGLHGYMEFRLPSSTEISSLSNGFTTARPNFAESISGWPDGFTQTISGSNTWDDDNTFWIGANFTDVLQICTLVYWSVEVLPA